MSKLLLPSLLAALGVFSTLSAQDAPRAVPVAADPAAKPAKPAPPVPEPGDPFVKGGPPPKKPATKAEEEVPRPVNCQLLLETFDLSREDFLGLLDGPGDDAARYRQIAEWMAAGRAKLVTFTALTVRSGQRVALESVDEVNYATELNPPQAEEDAAFPTAFETRDTGETLEVELTVGEDGQRANVNIVPHFCRLVKFADDFASPGRANSAVSQPRFARCRLTTSAALTMNRPRLLGTLSAAGEDGAIAGQVRVAFLTVRPNVLPRAKPEALAPGSNLLRMEYTFFSLERTAARELWLAKPEPQTCYDALRALVAEKKARLEHASVIAAVVEQFAPSFHRRALTVRRTGDATAPCLLDADALAQILANLFSNVEKYVPGGAVEIASTLAGGALTITAADAGPGIAARDLAASMGGSLRLRPSARGASFELRVPAPPAQTLTAVA